MVDEPSGSGLLAADEPAPVKIINAEGASDFVVVCEHAGRMIPRALGALGVDAIDRGRHIAWDVGARALAEALAERLEAILFVQRYSRLVCDCNRDPGAIDYIPVVSESTVIPGNRDVTPQERGARTAAIFTPFHDAVASELVRRARDRRKTVLVTVHSFTPIYKDMARPWHVGVLFNRDGHLSPAIAEHLQREPALCVGINQPYAVSDETDYTIPVHGERRGLPCVEFEIRNDLLATPEAAAQWADRLSAVVTAATAQLPAAAWAGAEARRSSVG